MSHRATSPPISLLPFLAVLVCTMGALILLLVTMAYTIRHQAIVKELARRAARELAQATPEATEEPEPLPAVVDAGPTPEEIAAQRAEREAARKAEQDRRRQGWLQSLAGARSERNRNESEAARTEAALRKTQEELRQAREQARRLSGRLDGTKAARQALVQTEQNLTQEQSKLVQQIASTRRNIDLANRKQASAPNEYALVPYDGTSGTQRHPIYIECTQKGFRFLPEGEFLGADQLDGFSENYNPLLVGTQTLLKYWTDRHIEDRREQPEPYVLLIVRPSGSFTYYVARKLLASLSVGFGYELVEEDWKVTPPKADPGSEVVLKEAIALSLDARQKVRSSVANIERRGGYVYSKSQGSDGMLVDPARTGNENLRNEDPWQKPPAGARRPGSVGADGMPNSAGGFAQGSAAPKSGYPGREPGRIPGFADGSVPAGPGTIPGSAAPRQNSREQPGFGPPPRNGAAGEPGAEHAGPHTVTLDERRLRTLEPDRSTLPPRGVPGEMRTTPGENESSNGAHPGFDSVGRAGTAGRAATGGRAGTAGTGIPGTPRQTESGDMPPELDLPGSSQQESDFTDVGKAAKAPNLRGGTPIAQQKRWGRSRSRASIGLEKKIDIHVHQDRIIVGNADSFAINPADPADRLVAAVVARIDQNAETWGLPPANFYWLPSIRFIVDPGASQYHEQLRAGLKKYGLSTSSEFAQQRPIVSQPQGVKR